MKIYQAAGIEKCDFGRIGPKNPRLTQFKLSFGGKLVMFDYALYAEQPGCPGVSLTPYTTRGWV